MSGYRGKRNRDAIAAALLAMAIACSVRAIGAQTADAISGDRMHALEQRVDRLAESLATAQTQVEQDRIEMQAMQAEIDDLRKTLAQGGGTSSPPELASTAGQLQQAITQIREEQEVIAAEVKQHEQTKVESATKMPVRFHGLVLFNAFVNEGVVDQPDLPTSALQPMPGSSHGSAGATLRQTMLSFEGIGPTVWNGRLLADASLDFFGGVSASATSAPAGLARMRTAGISWNWSADMIRAGYDGPLISPLSPTSIATVAQPALAWSGNLWTWAPQLRWQHRFALSEDKQAGLELGLYDPSYTAEDEIEAYRSISPGEAARQPGYETRISYGGGRDRVALEVGASGYFDKKSYGAGETVDTWAGAADWKLPFGPRVNLTGEFYRGRGIGSLGGGAYRDAYVYYPNYGEGETEYRGVDSAGGWAQWQWDLTGTMQLNAVGGQDTGYANELSYSVPQVSNLLDYYARNRTLMANFIYRPWSSFVFSPEFRRLDSWPIYGQVQTANIYTLSAGYEF
jgi:hypothetical protein